MSKIKVTTNMISRYEIEEDKFFAMFIDDYEDFLADDEDTKEKRKKFVTEWAWEVVPYCGDVMTEIFDDCDIEVKIDG